MCERYGRRDQPLFALVDQRLEHADSCLLSPWRPQRSPPAARFGFIDWRLQILQFLFHQQPGHAGLRYSCHAAVEAWARCGAKGHQYSLDSGQGGQLGRRSRDRSSSSSAKKAHVLSSSTSPSARGPTLCFGVQGRLQLSGFDTRLAQQLTEAGRHSGSAAIAFIHLTLGPAEHGRARNPRAPLAGARGLVGSAGAGSWLSSLTPPSPQRERLKILGPRHPATRFAL